jgi:aryl-alcohol dehydrogenase-like predicted oxidoreductase
MAESRRRFLELTGAAALAVACNKKREQPLVEITSGVVNPGGATTSERQGDIPRRALGKTGRTVSIVGVGGAHLGAAGSRDEATRIVHEAIDAGVDFFDNAWEYHDGRSEEWMGDALEGKREKIFLMTKVCTHGRGADVAMRQLEDSLRRLRTDHLDLWQVHECIYESDPARCFAAGGVIEALDAAKQQGKVRHVGFTGHKDPRIHLAMLAHGYAFDTVQMPLNAFDASFRSFQRDVLPEVRRRGMAAIGMKSFGGGGDPIARGVVSADEALRYAMTLPVATVVSGIDSLAILRQNVAIARGFLPMNELEMHDLEKRCAALASGGELELYKTTLRFDGRIGRALHGVP